MSLIHNTVAGLLQTKFAAGDGRLDSCSSEAGSVGRLAFDLQSLNFRFLSYVAAMDDRTFADAYDASFVLLARALRDRSHTELAAIATCPIALFDLDFENSDRWLRLLGAESETPAAPVHGLDPQRSELVQSIVFFAWHAAQTNPIFVSFALGLRESTVRMLASTSIADGTLIAANVGPLLAPRWGGNGCFWPDLLRFVSTETRLPFQASKLQACQLSAAAHVVVPRDDRISNRQNSRK